MRQARKRAISRRKPFQIGFGITFSVFLSLVGLMVFERIILFTSIIGLGYEPASEAIIFKYGADGTMGPWDWMAIALLGLFLAQIYRAFYAWQNKQSTLIGIQLSFCNIAMIALFTCGLAINWAFYNPLSPGAAYINGLATHPLMRSDFYQPEAYDYRQRTDDWEQLDEVTYRHKGAGIIEREEIIKPDFPLEFQRANFLARNIDGRNKFYEKSITATHIYDLDWNLLTINDSKRWPKVRERLEAAGKPAFDGNDEVYQRFKSYQESLPPQKPLTYEEILVMVEASWEGISLEPEDTPTLAPEDKSPSSNRE